MPRFLLLDSTLQCAVILGDASGNELHRHYNMHLGMPLSGSLSLHVEATADEDDHGRGAAVAKQVSTAQDRETTPHTIVGAVLIAANEPHAVRHARGNPILLLSFSPMSRLGLYAGALLKGAPWLRLSRPYLADVRDAGLDLYRGQSSVSQFRDRIHSVINKELALLHTETLHRYDPRIGMALSYLSQRSAAVVPAQDVADVVGLSRSRFLHLFKSELGITYRRMQIWIKLVASFSLILAGRGLTDVAIETGFADSAHFSRSFRETFGMAPTSLFRDSTFVQVR